MEHSRAAEELVFGVGQLYTGTKLELDEMLRADEIRQLKQSVTGRPYVVCKLHDSSDAGLEHLVKHAGYWRLPAKTKWRDENPATHAESFPRIPVTPSRRKRSVRIVAYPLSARKWAKSKSSRRCAK